MSRLIPFDNSYARDLPGAFLPVQPAVPPAPATVFFNEALAADLGLDVAALHAAVEQAHARCGAVWHLNLHSMPDRAFERLGLKRSGSAVFDWQLAASRYDYRKDQVRAWAPVSKRTNMRITTKDSNTGRAKLSSGVGP